MNGSNFILQKVNKVFSEVKWRVLKQESMSTDPDRLDLIVFGATGYTGKCAVKNLVSLSKQYNVKWGIAGRNLAALQNSLKWASDKTGENLIDIPIVIADLKTESSILIMAKKCRVLLNCVGPYTWYGETVVKACIEAKTHHLDITGEPYFMEHIQYEYNSRAQESEVYIVSACGIETLPLDMGVLMLQDMFEGQPNSMDCYISFGYEGSKRQKGAALHTGTWDSALLIGKMEDKRKEIHRKLYPTGLKQFDPLPEPRAPVHKFNSRYCVEAIIGPDQSVISRTQQYLYENQGRRPVPFKSYFMLPYWLLAWGFYIAALVFLMLTKFNPFCILLSKFPQLYSFGMVSREGPREDELEFFKMKTVIQATGWESKTSKKDKTMQLTLKCSDPGYNFTSTILIMAGITLLKETEHLPAKGGVFTPGALFYKTNIMDELCKQGLTIEKETKT
uniref:Saccharopine dehydrogenase-like oxidoreductase n=2 Tax=Cacopsylla melanoneura TaxID=428564 RepID=A0A8D9EYS6_9HEMI